MADQQLRVCELVDKISRGDIRLPELQRQFVWKQTRVRDLLDSLYRGYPSGAILMWEAGEDVATRDFAIQQNDVQKQNFQLLLDGQQRLTSLSAIIRGAPVTVRDRKRPIDILFNLEHPDALEEVTEVVEGWEEDNNSDVDAGQDESATDASEDEMLIRQNRRAFVVSSNKLAQMPQWVSVTHVFSESNNTPFLRKAGLTDWDDPKFHKYDQRLKRLRDIKDYKYSVCVLERNKSYEEVTEIFVRVNSLGTKLNSSDLALAQITAKWRNSLRVFQEFDEEGKDSGFDLGLAVHLRNLVSFATGRCRFGVVGGLSEEKLRSSWEDAKRGMRFAWNVLRSNVGIDNPVLLSSPFVAILLAQYGHLKKYELSPEEDKELCRYVKVSNAKGRYSRGSSETFLDQDMSALRREGEIEYLFQLLKAQVGRMEVLPEDLQNRNSRSAYFKTMFMAFRERGARDWNSQLAISLKHSGVQHSLQFHHFFPQAVLRRAGRENAEINDICNLVFIGGGTNRKIGDAEPTEYLRDVMEKLGKDGAERELGKQCIPTQQYLWEVENYDEFLVERRKLVANRLNEFLGVDQ